MKPTYFRDNDLLVIGETYVEFRASREPAVCEEFHKDMGGGDVYVAACASHLGSSVSFVSAVARDPFHQFLRDRLLGKGLNIDHVVTVQGYNGIYIAASKNSQEREYLYHRPGTAAESLSPAMIYDDLIDNTKVVYASSELQSVSKAARHTVFKAFHYAHRNDIMVAYDPNLRLRRWSLDDAKESLWGVLPLVDVILPSCPDESKALFGYERPVDVIGFLWDRGVSIVVVKNGALGCMVGYDGRIEEYRLPDEAPAVADLTLVGSVFNGAFLHSIARGQDPFTAAGFANLVASHKAAGDGGLNSLPDPDRLSAQ